MEYLASHWMDLAIPAAVLGVTVVAGFIARRIVLSALDRWARRTKTELDNILVESLRGAFMLWVVILGLILATGISVLPEKAASFVNRGLVVLWVLSLTLVASKLAASMVRYWGRTAGGVLPVTTLTQNVARITVIVVGLLILLSFLGISITPILTALGVGGLAVALALQDTLANFFAGFYISLAGQIRVGDYVKLDSGEEGYVTDIGWRSTLIRALANNQIIVPNAKLAQANVTNYHLPEKRMSLLIRIGVDYSSDPRQVERILIEEVTAAAADTPGLLAQPAPFVRFIPGFGDSSLDFTLICQVAEFVDQYLVQHELRKRIFERFRREGINIPFPIRTLHVAGLGEIPKAISGAAGSRSS